MPDESPPPDPATSGAGPADPFTALAAGAHQLHELFSAYVEAGFARHEALDIIKTIMSIAILKGPQPGGGLT